MKIFLLSLFVILTACGRATDAVIDTTTEAIIEETIATIPPGTLYSNPNQPFLDDLDILIDILQNNFGSLGTALHDKGFDIISDITALQNKIYNDDNFTVIDFYRYLTEMTMQVHPVAHFWFLPFPQNHPLVTEAMYAEHVAAADSAIASITNVDLERFDYYRGLYLQARPSISHRSITEGQVALLTINSMHPVISSGGNQWNDIVAGVADFYYHIQDYQHLIIDLRGNGGGSPAIFHDLVLHPLLPDGHHIQFDMYLFTPTGEIIQPFIEEPLSPINLQLAQNLWNTSTALIPTADILAQAYLPELILANVENLPYGIPLQFSLRASSPPRFRDVQYTGKLWLLIDENVSSAGHMAAYIARESGMFTLVGNTTGGNFAGNGIRARATLPHSRLVFQFDPFLLVDSRGRSTEAGILPHYFNKDGMDALDTALMLIAQGD